MEQPLLLLAFHEVNSSVPFVPVHGLMTIQETSPKAARILKQLHRHKVNIQESNLK